MHSLKCVAHFPKHRPFICKVLEKIKEVVNAHEDFSPSFDASVKKKTYEELKRALDVIRRQVLY